jgi:hypothetical protein
MELVAEAKHPGESGEFGDWSLLLKKGRDFLL